MTHPLPILWLCRSVQPAGVGVGVGRQSLESPPSEHALLGKAYARHHPHQAVAVLLHIFYTI